MKKKLSLDLRALERVLLPPSPPLAGRWSVWRCDDCGGMTYLDQRLERQPVAKLLKRVGWAKLHCNFCSSTRVTWDRILVS